MASLPPKHSLSSPTAGNTHQPVLPTPSSSTSVSLRQMNYRSLQIKKELELQLVEKQRQMQESSSGIGKNVLARQIAQLQERIDNVTQLMDLQPTNSIERLKFLERDLTSFRPHPLSPGMSSIRNKEKLLNHRSTSTSSTSDGLSPLPSPSVSTMLPSAHGYDSTSLLPLPPPPTGSTPTKRRSKIPTTDRRNNDIEFATEIGQGLLLEVRKMQALLQEKDEKLRVLENQKADLERTAEAISKQMRQKEESEEKLKEETWNLELAKQELVISVTELQSNLNKANSDQFKLAKQVNELRSEIEHLRDKEEKLTSTIDNMKQRHEQDMTSIRRQAAAFQREKQEQTKKIQALTSELTITKAQSRIGKHILTDCESSNRRAGDLDEQPDNDQLQSTFAVKNENSPISSPPTSPKITPNRNQAMEFETLKTSLAHAHRMVSNLRSSLHKEKTEKFEFKKLLAESQETIEQLQNDPRLWVDAGPTRNSNSSPTISKAEEGVFIGRRTRKISRSSSRRRGKRQRHKFNKNKNTSENDSVYSYSSMSDNDSSLDESDADLAGKAAVLSEFQRPKAPAFTVLSSELSQIKPIVIDAQVNTDPIYAEVPRSLSAELEIADLPVRTEATLNPILKQQGTESFTQTEPRSGTEIISQIDMTVGTEVCIQTECTIGTDNFVQTNPMPTMTATAMQTEKELPPRVSDMSMQTQDACTFDTTVQTDDPPALEVSEISTQTDTKPDYLEMHVQTDDPPALEVSEISTQTDTKPDYLEMHVQTEDALSSDMLIQTDPELKPVITETWTQTETGAPSEIFVQTESPIASEISVQTEAAIPSETFVQTEPTIPSETFVQTESATVSEIFVQTETVVPFEILVQTDVEPIPMVSETSTQTNACVLEQVTLKSVSKEPYSLTLSDYSPTSVDIQPEDPSIVAATLAAAVQAARLVSIENAVDHETQFDAKPTIDHDTQYDAAPTVDQATQYDTAPGTDCGVQSETRPVDACIQIDAPELTDACVQYDTIETKDSLVQSESTQTKDSFVQCESVQSIDTQVQSELTETKDSSSQSVAVNVRDVLVQYEPMETKDRLVQYEPVQSKDMLVQSEPQTVDSFTQYDSVKTKDSIVQSDSVETRYSIVQSDSVETRDSIVQSDSVETRDSVVQSDSVETRDSVVQSDSVETRDSIVQSDSVETRDSIVQSDSVETRDSIVQSDSVETRDSIVQSDSVETRDSIVQSDSVETRDSIVQSEPPETKDSVIQYESVNTVDSVVQYDPIETKDACVQYEEGFSSAEGFLGMPLFGASVFNNSQLSDYMMTDSTHCKTVNKVPSADPTTFQKKNDVLWNHSPVVSETVVDSFDQSMKVYSKAEADKLIEEAIASALAPSHTVSSEHDSDSTEETKRHTCDMSSNNKRVHSVSTTPYTGSLYMIDDDDFGDHDFGDVMIHLPTDQDIITYSSYREEREKRQVHHPLELSIGPSIVHEFKPSEDEVSPMTVVAHDEPVEKRFKPTIEIPARPASRPPTDLLSRATTPVSDKQKVQYDTLPSIPTHKKAPSVSGSSMSSAHNPEYEQNTDPVLSMITQTMIGDWMWKYTRNTVGQGISENRHRRYFWIHPYTRTLYWSTNVPGSEGDEAKTKSALVESVTTIPDSTASTYGLPNVSLLIQTSQRQLKLTAPTMEKHETWLESLSYLVTHAEDSTGSGLTLLNDRNKKTDPPLNLLSSRSLTSMNSGSLLRGPNFRRTNDILHHHPSVSTSMVDPFDLDDDNDPLEDVRMCCNGKHHVSRLEKDHAHRHQYRKRKSRATIASFA